MKLLLVIIVVAAIFVGYNLVQDRGIPILPIIVEEGVYQLGNIVVDSIKGEIRFSAEVRKSEGWVQHLVYLHGYKWLKEESAIISQDKLFDLQKAIALLDWELWETLRYRKKQNAKMLIVVKWGSEKILAQELVAAEDKLWIWDFIFLGSPYFDNIVLKTHQCVDCSLCPIFPLEKKALREVFIRKSGLSGYELNSEKMPPQGTEVNIIIRLLK